MKHDTNAVSLFSQYRSYQHHRSKIFKIMTKSNSAFNQSFQQDHILLCRHHNQLHSAKLKQERNQHSIKLKNKQIIHKILSFSDDKKNCKSNSLEYSRRIQKNKLPAQQKNIEEIFNQNKHIKNKLLTVKSTINTNKQNYSFYEHRKRSQMLSRFVKEGENGKVMIKAQKNIKRRVRMYLKGENEKEEKRGSIKLQKIRIGMGEYRKDSSEGQ